MKVVLFTPVSASSAIGRVSLLVSAELRSQGHEVVIISTDEHAQGHAAQVADLGFVIHWRDEASVYLAVETADMIVHQIGDNYAFHVGSVHWLDAIGGVVCLHDYFLGGLFVNWSVQGNEHAASQVLHEWYGRSLAWFHSLAQAGDLITESWPSVSFVEWIVSKASGVIVHSDFAIESVMVGTGSPVAVVPLPYDLRYPVGERRSDEPPRPARVLTIGTINVNKRAEDVVRAIGSDPTLVTAVQYRLSGSIEPEMRSQLTSLATRLGVDLVILGPVSDADLAAELEHATAVACVRLPALESASASAIEAMLAARPLIVADTGFYASLPNDAVIKIDPSDAVSGIAKAMQLLLSDPAGTRNRGENARRYAEATFSADSYAVALLAMADRVDRARAQFEITSAVARVFADWGVSPHSQLLNHTRDLVGFFAPTEK